MDISRRAFVAWSAAAGMGFPSRGLAQLLDTPMPAGDAAQPVCVFTKHLQWLDYDELAAVAAEAGFQGLDLTVRAGGHVLPERVATDLPRAVAAARKAGLGVPMITTTISDARHPHSEAILRVAQEQGVQIYRMGWIPYPGDKGVREGLESLRPAFRELAALNERFGIHGAYQNHAGTRVGGPVWDLAYLLEGLDPRWIGVQYDIRHATVEGGMAWPLALKLLRPFIRNTDIKDFVWQKRGDQWRVHTVPLGEGMVDFDAYLKLVNQLGIQGPISMHFEYAPLEGPNDLPHAARRRQAIQLMRTDLERFRSMQRAVGA